jgi:hypothetical protein
MTVARGPFCTSLVLAASAVVATSASCGHAQESAVLEAPLASAAPRDVDADAPEGGDFEGMPTRKNPPVACQHDPQPSSCALASESPEDRLAFATCEETAGHLVDALADFRKALQVAVEKKNSTIMRQARLKVKDVTDHVPHFMFDAHGVSDSVEVHVDDRSVARGDLGKSFSIDPGRHDVVARDPSSGRTFRRSYCVAPGETTTVKIELAKSSGS